MKGSNHKSLTQIAVDIFTDHFDSPLAGIIAANRRCIAEFSEAEDTSPLVERITNWHFFKSHNDLKPGRYQIDLLPGTIPVTPTSERILATWLAEFTAARQENDTDTICDRLGRILHHVQDMSTPAHVTPVFHDMKTRDSYELHLYKRVTGGLLETVPRSSCIAAYSEKPPAADIMTIYRDAARETQQLLAAPIPVTVDGTDTEGSWNLFWKEFSPDTARVPPDSVLYGFGSYGPLGRDFGATAPVRRRDVTYRISQQVYDSLMTTLVRNAIGNSIRALVTAAA
jgi:hypothetical protein